MFFVFMFVASLFVLNMFVGITITVFSDEKDKLNLNHLLTEMQDEWCEVMIGIYNTKPNLVYQVTGNCFFDGSYWIASSNLFDNFIFFCILLNTGCMMATWYDQPADISGALDWANVGFNIIYTFESGFKIIAFGCDFFKDGWNVFDFSIVISGWLGFIAERIPGLSIGSILTLFRAFRICRIFKIIKTQKEMRVLFFTFVSAIPQLTYIGGLLILFLFIYSVLGVQLFALVKFQDAINMHANFRNFFLGMVTLFRMSTGESWHELMYDAGR